MKRHNFTKNNPNKLKNSKSVLNMGGKLISIDSKKIVFSVGQPTPVVVTFNDNYINYSGFIPGNVIDPNIGSIEGHVSYAITNNLLRKTKLMLTNDSPRTYLTDSTGFYSFIDLDKSQSHKLQPQKDNDYFLKETINFNDASKVIAYIMGYDTLSNDQFWAADVNENGMVDDVDKLYIIYFAWRGESTDSSDHTGEWRFDPPDTVLSFSDNSTIIQNFKSVLLGDVDGSLCHEPQPLAKNKIFHFQHDYLNHIYVEQDSLFSIPILVNDSINIKTSDICVDFNPEQIGFVKIDTNGTNIRFVDCVLNNKKSGTIKIALFCTIPINQTGNLLSLYFKAIGSEGLNGDINIRNFVVNKNIEFKTKIKFEITQTLKIPEKYELGQNYPNPFNMKTIIPYQIKNSEAQKTTINIFNIKGQLIKTLLNKNQKGGFYKVIWDGTNNIGEFVSNGIYFYSISSGRFKKTNKLLVLK